MQKITRGLVVGLILALVAGCASSAQKARKEQREKIAQSAKMYCDFVNGEIYPADIEVVLNLEMAKRCDSDRGFSVTSYKTPSENSGLIYCCSIKAGPPGSTPVASSSSAVSSPTTAASSPTPAAAGGAKAPVKPAAGADDELE